MPLLHSLIHGVDDFHFRKNTLSYEVFSWEVQYFIMGCGTILSALFGKSCVTKKLLHKDHQIYHPHNISPQIVRVFYLPFFKNFYTFDMMYIFGGAFDPPHVGHSAIVRALLHYKNPEKIVIIPSSERDDKEYHVSDRHRLAMLEIFCEEIGDARVVLDDYFVKNWHGKMITRDVDQYAKKTYGTQIVHIFGTDTIASMPDWDEEGYAARVVEKIFIPREGNFPLSFSSGESLFPTKRSSAIAKDDKNTDRLTSRAITIEERGIENFEVFTDSHIPDISSTALRQIIPEYTSLKALYSEDPKFIIPGLSTRISRYILEHRLYRDLPDPDHERGTHARERSPKPKILLHVCCGPDVTMPILQLRDEYDILCFWYDPNIQPKSEYDKRFAAFKKVCEIENIPYIKGAYDVGHFLQRIRGLERTPER